MHLKKIFILCGFAMVMLATTQIILAQESTVTAVDPTLITSNQETTSQKESQMQWAWGEVTNLDNQANTVTLKYLDYETDQEQELVLLVDDKTTFENIKDFNELKLKDTLSIDYMVGADKQNIAKNISFENPDVASAASVLPNTTALDLAQPTVGLETPIDPSIIVNEASAPVEPALTPAAAEPVQAVQGQAQ